MEITSEAAGDFLLMRATGRLDGSWAEHLATTLDELVREGHHRIRIDLAGVTYISSMGIGVLVECYKSLATIQGVLVVSNPSPVVRKVLDMVDLSTLLLTEPPPRAAAAAAAASMTIDHGEGRFEVFRLAGAGMRCRVLGDPAPLDGCRFGAPECAPVPFGASTFGIGLGAFGTSFDDCRNRFGEFLAVGGAAAYQPADGSNAADFMLGREHAFPDVQVLYGLAAEGAFSCMARFEATGEADAVTLTTIGEAALALSACDAAWIVIAAESAGLAGVSLRQSPVGGQSANAPFAHPDVREWLSFTTERAHVRALALATGLVLGSERREFDRLTRPLSRGASVRGHVHAAAFSYRPLQQGLIALGDTVRSLFGQQTLQGVLHLIGDDRQSERVSESEFIRGAVWVAPIRVGETARGAR